MDCKDCIHGADFCDKLYAQLRTLIQGDATERAIQTAPPHDTSEYERGFKDGNDYAFEKIDKPPTEGKEMGEGDTCGFCNGPTRHITDGDWCTRCGTMNTDESITAPTDDELKPTPGTQWTHECDRCGAIAKNPALMCCAICDEGRMVKINGNG